MLILKWEYLMGKSVAAQWGDRSCLEWPPHPDRVFQALVAAWGEIGCRTDQRNALTWLECQPPPHLSDPGFHPCSDRPVYVPVNDIEASARTKKYADKMMELLPNNRSKAKRHFPACAVSGACALIWPEATPDTSVLSSLRELCANVTHVGHSSSLVRMWIADDTANATHAPSDDHSCDLRLRVPSSGRLEALIHAYADGGENWKRPPAPLQQPYVCVSDGKAPPVQGVLDNDWIIYRIVDGTRFNLAQTLAVADAFRKRLIAAAERSGLPDAKALLSGHAADGAALTTPHATFTPLGFVDHEHADGHLMGLAVILPRGLSFEARDACLAALAESEDPESGAIKLSFTSGDRLTFVREDREVPPTTLQALTWCKPSDTWATATPIALDRMPSRRQGLTDGWAADQVAKACVRIGLPIPFEVTVLPVSRLVGAPSCKTFPPLLRRADHAPRWHVHAEILFPQKVRGPILLGAGRFRGYGLCRPLESKK